MKASKLLFVMMVLGLLFTSCDPYNSDELTEDIETSQTLELDCCGEQGDLPSEPGDDQEED